MPRSNQMPDTYPAMVGKRLKAAREARKMTQKDVVKRADPSGRFDSNVYGRYERGVSLPTAEMLVQVCKALEISADYVLGLTDDMSPKGKGIKGLTHRELQIVLALRENDLLALTRLAAEPSDEDV